METRDRQCGSIGDEVKTTACRNVSFLHTTIINILAVILHEKKNGLLRHLEILRFIFC